MRFDRVPFGNKSSPILLNATINHLPFYPTTKVFDELKENLYVDDWLSEGDTDKEVCDLIKD